MKHIITALFLLLAGCGERCDVVVDTIDERGKSEVICISANDKEALHEVLFD